MSFSASDSEIESDREEHESQPVAARISQQVSNGALSVYIEKALKLWLQQFLFACMGYATCGKMQLQSVERTFHLQPILTLAQFQCLKKYVIRQNRTFFLQGLHYIKSFVAVLIDIHEHFLTNILMLLSTVDRLTN